MAGYNEDVNINLNILAGAMGGITAITSGMSALTSTFGQFGTTAVDTFGNVDGLLVSATALIGAFGVEAANAAGEFEQSMKIVQAVSGQTGGAIAELGEQANQLSVQYRTAIGDITEGLQTLGRAGLNSADTQLSVLEDGLQTAKLEGRNLNSVLEELIQNTAMLGGNLDSIDFGAQTQYVNSLMVGTSMSAPIDTHDISQTLQYVGGTAAAAGANLEDKEKLEDLMGTIAAFAQKGVTGSMAGTALRAFLTKPASQDKSVVNGLSAIGLSPEDLWEDGGESMKDISDQIALIQHQMDKLNLSTMDQLEIWGKIVGPKMGQQMMKLEADKIEDLKSDIQEAASAEELATSTLQTYNQKISEMGEIGSGIFRQFGANVVMWLNPILETVNKIASIFNNKWGGIFIFGGFLAIVSRGLQAAYGMVIALVGQLRSIFTEARSALANISGEQEGIISGANRYDNIVQKAAVDIRMMNSNLQETTTLWGQFQAAALGKTATSQIRGYGSHNPMPQSLIGITDNYTQYFRKPDIEYDYEAYQFKNAFGGINKAQYDSLSKSDKRFFENIGDLTYQPKKKVISEADYEKLSERVQKYFDKTTISQLEYDAMNSIKRKPYKKIEDSARIVNQEDVYSHLFPGEYQSLSAEEKSKYSGRKFRLEDHYLPVEEMEKKIRNDIEDLRIVSADELRAATPEQKKAIEKQTRATKDAIAEQLINDAKNKGKIYVQDSQGNNLLDVHGNPIDSGYRHVQTLKNIPQSEDLAVLQRRQAKEWAQAMANAKYGVDLSKTRESVRGKLGRGSKSRFDALDKLRVSANQASQAVSKGGQTVSSSSNTVKGAASGIRGKFQELRNNVSTGLSSLTSFGQGISLTAESLGPLTDSFFNAGASIANGTGQFVTALEFSEMTIEEQFAAMAAEMDINEKEFAELVIASDEVCAAFARVAGASEAEVLEEAGQVLEKNTSKMGGAISEFVGMMGGPATAAIMGLTVAVQVAQQMFQDWQKRMQEAEKGLSEANQKRQEAEQSIKDIYSSENENLTEADLNRAITEQYGTIGNYQLGDSLDNYGSAYVAGDIYYQIGKDEDITSRVGDEHIVDSFELANEDNIKALNENTVQLAAATNEYAKAAEKANKEINDPIFGLFGESTKNADAASWWADMGDADRFYFNGGSPYLTESQRNENYPASKELAAVLAADAKKRGSWEGLLTGLGTDIDDIKSIVGEINTNTLQTHGQNMVSMDPQTAGMAQILWKDNKESIQRGAKLMAKWEQKRGSIDNSQLSPLANGNIGTGGAKIKPRYSAYDAAMERAKNKKTGQKDSKADKIENKELAELKAIERDLDNEIANMIKLSNNRLNEANVLAMYQLQQFQDMYDVANSVIAPGVMNAVQAAYNNVSATQGVGQVTGVGAGGSVTAGENAQIIAAFLTKQATSKAGDIMYEDKLAQGDWKAVLASHLGGKDVYKGLVSNEVTGKMFFSEERDTWGRTLAELNAQVQNPGQKPEYYREQGKKNWDTVKEQMDKYGSSFYAGLQTINRPLEWALTGATQAAYLNSQTGEYGSNRNPSGSGGSGSGDGGSDKGDSDSGNKKNRVDLVLCNKKEIPKLNVNLFKKEPNFTVLNKNFKVRDIKINTQDTPKSILSAVKNGIIDTAKRMDPKIIQDGESVYDPVGATEGKDTPSGTTPTSSN